MPGSAYFFSKLTTNSSSTAPTTAVTREPIIPLADIPSSPNMKPPITAPITSTTILPRTPNPPPFMRFPANQPASAPSARKIKSDVIPLFYPYFKIQCCAKSVASLADQSPFGLAFISAHYCLLPILFEHPESIKANRSKKPIMSILFEMSIQPPFQ